MCAFYRNYEQNKLREKLSVGESPEKQVWLQPRMHSMAAARRAHSANPPKLQQLGPLVHLSQCATAITPSTCAASHNSKEMRE
eukprot:1845168-Amphidinium_carterae.1